MDFPGSLFQLMSGAPGQPAMTAKSAADAVVRQLSQAGTRHQPPNHPPSVFSQAAVSLGQSQHGGQDSRGTKRRHPSPLMQPPNPSLLAPPESAEKQAQRKKAKGGLPDETADYLKAWILSPEHFNYPYPNENEKRRIMSDTGIEAKQLSNWFVNNRKRLWKPMINEQAARLEANGEMAEAEQHRLAAKNAFRKSHGGTAVHQPPPSSSAVPSSSSYQLNPAEQHAFLTHPLLASPEAAPRQVPAPPPLPPAPLLSSKAAAPEWPAPVTYEEEELPAPPPPPAPTQTPPVDAIFSNPDTSSPPIDHTSLSPSDSTSPEPIDHTSPSPSDSTSPEPTMSSNPGSSEPSKSTPAEGITVIEMPNENDVLTLFRGSSKVNHPGNRSYRRLLVQHKPSYDAATDSEGRRRAARDVLDGIWNSGGRFLKRLRKEDGGLWSEMPSLSCMKKVHMAFRDQRLLQTEEEDLADWTPLDIEVLPARPPPTASFDGARSGGGERRKKRRRDGGSSPIPPESRQQQRQGKEGKSGTGAKAHNADFHGKEREERKRPSNSGDEGKVHPYALDLIRRVVSETDDEEAALSVLERDPNLGDGDGGGGEGRRERLIRLQLQTRYVAAAKAGITPKTFSERLLQCLRGQLNVVSGPAKRQ